MVGREKKEILDLIEIKNIQLHFTFWSSKALSRFNKTDLIIPQEIVHPKLNTTIHRTQ
jgi:hypothetical protein